MDRIQIYLPKSQKEKLTDLARSKNLTISEVIRVILQDALNTKTAVKPDQTPISAKMLLTEIKRLGGKGPKDLSKNIDAYLYGGKK